MTKKLPVLLDLPEMRCDANCDLCCSDVVPVSEAELVRIVLHANERGIVPQTARPDLCVWYQGGRCAVHEVRPMMCQLYGHVDHPALTCAKDPAYNTNIGALPTPAVFAMKQELGPSVRYLHEVIDEVLTQAGLDPEASVWRARVQPHVWDGINQIRESSGLPALVRKHNLHQQKADGTP
jgi:Fe-S-cluster containining protein